MPCFSVITRTKMRDADRIANALNAIGYVVERNKNGTRVGGTSKDWTNIRSVMFSRLNESEPFAVTGDTADIKNISRKYAEIGVRDWAKRRGFAVQKSDGRKIELVNRRG